MSWNPRDTDHLYTHVDRSKGFYIVRTYHVNTTPELFCEHVMRSCFYVLDHRSEGADSELEVQGGASDTSGIVEIKYGDEAVLRFMFLALTPPKTTTPEVRVHAYCYDKTVFNILREVNDRVQDIYQRHWRDRVPEASGAPVTPMHRSLNQRGQGGRLPNELYDSVFEEMQQNNLSMDQAFSHYLELLKEKEDFTVVPDDRSMYRDKFRKAMQRRQNGLKGDEGRLD